MEVTPTIIEGVYIIDPKIFGDDRGYFFESFNEKEFNEKTGADFHPIQDNESKSCKGVLRGLHFQCPPYAQAKLVRVVKGGVIDVAVDIRKGSPTYGKYTYVILNQENHKQFFLPKGMAHGFVALTDEVVFQYKCDNYYNKESEGAVSYDSIDLWDKLQLKDLVGEFILSEKDQHNKNISELNSPFDYEVR